MHRPAIIFDFGNVVAFFDYQRACSRLGARLGLSGPDFQKRLTGAGFAQIASRFECGRISSAEFERTAAALAGLEINSGEFRSAWQDIFWLNEPVAGLVRQLKAAGYRLVLGSNTNSLHADYFREQFAATLDHFDRMILSYEVGVMKPDAAFYHACVAAAGLPAEACVFVDDLAENVAGAVRAGLTGVRYVDTPALIADLQALGVEIAAGKG